MIIVDASAIINTKGKFKHVVYTTKEVYEELKDFISRSIAEASVLQRQMVVVEAKEELKDSVRKKAKELGLKLSDADVSILALALEMKNATVISDDFSLQNLARVLGIKVKGATREIKKVYRFVFMCPFCKFTGKRPGECPNCGTKLKKLKIPLFEEKDQKG